MQLMHKRVQERQYNSPPTVRDTFYKTEIKDKDKDKDL